MIAARKVTISHLFLLVTLLLAACSGNGSGVPQNAVHVSFTYGSEKQAWIEAVTASFNATNPKTASGKPIVIDVTPIGSGESMDDILQGRAQPVLWSPASSLWLPIINDEWTRKNGKDILNEADCKNLVLSPVVIMMWKPMAEALGWPQKPIGWADLAKLATSPNGWADYGKPQWGPFRFGHTHPDYSNSGLQTIVAMAYAATNPARRLSEADVQKPETVKFLHDLESAVAHYGRSTGFFGTEMGARGTAYLSAAVVYESIVVDNNNDPQKKAKLEFPLVAIYPKEGTFMSDHPACVLDAPWVTAETKEAATLYRTYLLSQSAQQQALQFGFRPSDPQIALGAPLTAENGVDIKQPQNTLAVPNATTIRAIRDLWKQAKRQVNLTLLLDVSGSMQGERITKAREGAVAFIDQLADTDNLTLITFSNGPAVVFENLAVGQNRDKIKNDINSIIANGGTALYDSIAFAIERMPKDPTRISALVVLTDGEDTASATYKDADTLMKRYGMKAEGTSDVSIFTIGYGNEADAQALQYIAKQGRGAFSKGSTADIRTVYLDISTFF